MKLFAVLIATLALPNAQAQTLELSESIEKFEKQLTTSCPLSEEDFRELYLAWLPEEPYGLIDREWQADARSISFYPLPRGVLSRQLKRYKLNPKMNLQVGVKGLQTLGYLTATKQIDCSLQHQIIDALKRDTQAWLSKTATLTTEQKYFALLNGLELNLINRAEQIVLSIQASPAYRPEAFLDGLERDALYYSIVSLTALEKSLSLGIPFERLDRQRTSLLKDTERYAFHKKLTAFHIEVLRQRIEDYETAIKETLGIALGLSIGFNALDGD